MTGPGLAVVTGASSGIGKATAQHLHRAGRPLLLIARGEQPMAELGLDRALVASVDVRDEDAMSAALADAEDRFGPVDTVVNVAGVMPLGDIADQAGDEWRTVMEVNVVGPATLTRLVLPTMIARGAGTVVVVSSLAARSVFPRHAAYCASKAAVHAFCEGLRLEAAPHGVRVIEIAPGMVDTGLVNSTPSPVLREEYLAGRQHVLTASEVADAIAWVCGLPEHVTVRELHLAHSRQV